MELNLTTEAETFFSDFAIAFSLVGAVFVIFGSIVGYMIWKKTRRLTEEIESGNRDAMSDFERTSDEMSRIKAGIKDAIE